MASVASIAPTTPDLGVVFDLQRLLSTIETTKSFLYDNQETLLKVAFVATIIISLTTAPILTIFSVGTGYAFAGHVLALSKQISNEFNWEKLRGKKGNGAENLQQKIGPIYTVLKATLIGLALFSYWGILLPIRTGLIVGSKLALFTQQNKKWIEVISHQVQEFADKFELPTEFDNSVDNLDEMSKSS